jgi:Zn-dependent peptidase ImmA (M78 family)/predicted secreted protein
MVDVRRAILRGTRQAARLHRDLDMRQQIAMHGGRIDVFGALFACHVPLIFKPLETLLGVFIREPTPGVLITTQRQLSVQRFTGAHELGHYLLNHQPSFDNEDILRRSPFFGARVYDEQELEADAFASAFLLPKWLFAAHFERQEWTAASMQDPRTVYQVSLRVGASFEATCYALLRHSIIDQETCEALVQKQPRTLKQELLAGYHPPSWYADVWLLTEKDAGTMVEGSHSDLFVVRLREHSNAGYLWNFEELEQAGFVIVRDERESIKDGTIGGEVIRAVTARSSGRHSGRLTLQEKRPWIRTGQPLSEFTLAFDMSGPEEEGLSQAERRHWLEVA